jgi:hypothetical protein
MSATRTIRFKEDPSKGSLGLQSQGRSKMPNCVDLIQPAKGLDGRWRTGLDELSTEVAQIQDSKEREAKKKEIIAERTELEKLLNKDLSGTSTFWETFYVEINPKVPLNLDLPLDRIKYNVILSHDAVAPNLAAGRNARYRNAKYYISREFEEVGDRVAKKRKAAEASSAMLDLLKHPDKAVIVGRYLDLPVRNGMPQDNLFDTFQSYLDSDDTLDSVDKLLNAIKKTPEELNIRLIYTDAINFKVIRYNDGLFQRGAITLGKSPDEVVSWLSNVSHSGELMSIKDEVENKRKFG